MESACPLHRSRPQYFVSGRISRLSSNELDNAPTPYGSFVLIGTCSSGTINGSSFLPNGLALTPATPIRIPLEAHLADKPTARFQRGNLL